MNSARSWIRKFFVLIQVYGITAVFSPGIALAYVDPGSGSVIVTSILGLIAAVGYTFRKYFYKIRRMISGTKAEKEKQEHD